MNKETIQQKNISYFQMQIDYLESIIRIKARHIKERNVQITNLQHHLNGLQSEVSRLKELIEQIQQDEVGE